MGKAKLYTAAGTVGVALATIGLMVAQEMKGDSAPVQTAGLIGPGIGIPTPTPAETAEPPMAEADMAAARPALATVADASLIPQPAALDTAPGEAAQTDAPMMASDGVPQLPAEPAVTMASLQLDNPGPELRARMASVLAPAADDPADAPQDMAAAPDAAQPDSAQPDSAQISRNEFGIPCGPMLSGAPAAGGMMALTLTAPCRAGQIVTVRQGALVYTDTISSLGSYTAMIPVLANPVEISVTFPDEMMVDLSIEAPDAKGLERVALQWVGESGLQIHALEFGAYYGEPGHVWSGAARGPEYAAGGRGGFLTRLGDGAGTDAHVAEVYTFPRGTNTRDGVVRLSVEAEVTAANCGREVAGQSLQPGLGGHTETVELTFAMPDCEAIGEFLVLKNVLRDLKVASN